MSPSLLTRVNASPAWAADAATRALLRDIMDAALNESKNTACIDWATDLLAPCLVAQGMLEALLACERVDMDCLYVTRFTDRLAEARRQIVARLALRYTIPRRDGAALARRLTEHETYGRNPETFALLDDALDHARAERDVEAELLITAVRIRSMFGEHGMANWDEAKTQFMVTGDAEHRARAHAAITAPTADTLAALRARFAP